MSKNLQSPTKLTEFAPLQPENNKSQTVGQFISNFFKKSRNIILEEPSNDNVGTSQESVSNWTESPNEARYKENDTLSAVYAVDVNEGRSLPNVLKRISNLLALKSPVSDLQSMLKLFIDSFNF